MYLLTTFIHFAHHYPTSLATTNLFCVSIGLVCSFFLYFYFTCKLDHTIFVFLCLTSFIYHAHPQVPSMLLKMSRFLSFSRLNNILFCVCVSVHMHTSHLYPFIRQQTFRLFHTLATMNTAAMNLRAMVSL